MIKTSINEAEIDLTLFGDFQTITAETSVFLNTVAGEMEKSVKGSGDMYLYFIQRLAEDFRKGGN